MSSDRALTDAVWRLQLKVRKNSMLIPGVLLLLCSILVLIDHMTSYRLNLRSFLTLFLVSMVPLAYVDSAISSRPDPIGLLYTFGGKVMLMHSCALLLRFRLLFFPGAFFHNTLNVAGFAGSLGAVFVGFRNTLGAKELWEVGVIVLLVVVAALGTELAAWGIYVARRQGKAMMLEVLGTASEYAEVLAFLPAVWIMIRSDKKDAAPVKVPLEDAKMAATAFLAFLVGFYFFEDVVGAVFEESTYMESAAHILHFLLLGDLASYLLIHAHNPDASGGTMLQRFSDACFGDCNV